MNYQNKIKIYVKSLKGKTFGIDVEPSIKIEKFKTIVQNKFGYMPD